jgi:hypothetical protein
MGLKPMAKCDLMSANIRWLCRQYMGCIESFSQGISSCVKRKRRKGERGKKKQNHKK